MTGSKSAPDRDPERLVRDYADLARYVRRIYLLYYEGTPRARSLGSSAPRTWSRTST